MADWQELLYDAPLARGETTADDAEMLLRHVGDLLDEARGAYDALKRYAAARRAAEASGLTVDEHDPGIGEETADAVFDLRFVIRYP